MIYRLVLHNIAIIEDMELVFRPGLNAITGETGSGKSVMLDAIQRIFQKKSSSKELLRHGASRGRVEVTFDLRHVHQRDGLMRILDDAGIELLEDEHELILGREFTSSSSRCRINGYPVPYEVMDRLGALLLEIYGQHDLHHLFSSSRQRDLLDNLGGAPLESLRQEVRQTYRLWQKRCQELEEAKVLQEERERQLDFLNYQISEITQAEITSVDEDAQLQLERQRLANSEQLCRLVLQTRYALSDDIGQEGTTSVLDGLNQAKRALNSGISIDTALSDWYERLQGVQETLRDLVDEMSRYAESLEMRPERLQEIVDRLDLLEKLKRKYGGTLEGILKTAAELEVQLDTLQAVEQRMTHLEEERVQLEYRYYELSTALTEMRQRIARALEGAIQEELASLMLPAAQFQIDLAAGPPSESGQDQVTFMFSANPGSPLRPLSQVASGGELARLMLALKIHTAHSDGLTSLILDEIDTGMSGVTLRAVADKLQALQSRCQIIVVTHQPIVAAKAPHHIHLKKQLHEDRVEVVATILSDTEARTSVLSQIASGYTTQDKVTSEFIEQLLR